MCVTLPGTSVHDTLLCKTEKKKKSKQNKQDAIKKKKGIALASVFNG